MNNGAFGENFPYTNFHDLNMDWIIQVVKDFLDKYSTIQETVDEGLTELTDKATELENLLQQWYDTHSEDIALELANSIAEFNTMADAKAQETIESIPDDYTALSNQVNELQFEMDHIADIHRVVATVVGGINYSYPMAVGDAINVTNFTNASIEVRQRDSGGNVIATTIVHSNTSRYIVSTVNSVDIRFYFNSAGTVEFENANYRLPVVEREVDSLNNSAELTEYMINSLYESELIYHNYEFHTDNLGVNDPIITIPANSQKQNYYLKATSFENVTNTFPIGIIELDSNGNQVNITGRRSTEIMAGAIITANNPATATIRIYANVGTNGQNKIKGLFIWQTSTGKVNRKPYQVFNVRKDGTGNYSNLVQAINDATLYMDSIVYVGKGNWDIIDELGTDYLNNVSSTQRGLILKNRVHIICDSQAKILANYTGSNNNVKTWLSVFNSGAYGFTLENAYIEGSNIRYLIHDERDQDSDPYINIYKNCTFEFDNTGNTAWSARQCIGGGLGKNGYIQIEGCSIRSRMSYDGTISYHNTASNEGKSHLIVKDNYFYNRNTFRLSWYGTSPEITEAIVTNNFLGTPLVERAENSSATVVNTKIVEWNNIVNPDNT